MTKKITQLLLVLFFTQISTAQIKIWKNPKSYKPIKTVQWEVNDIIYHVNKSVKNPFDQTAFAFVTNGTKEQKIPLFYNGANNWVFRFSSATEGTKTFHIESSLSSLDKKKGKILISNNLKKERHGGIVTKKENPQHFFYEDDSHYFNLAFECDWLFALDYGQKDIPKTKHLLSLLNEYKFNQIVMNVYSYDVKWQKDPRLKKYPEQ